MHALPLGGCIKRLLRIFPLKRILYTCNFTCELFGASFVCHALFIISMSSLHTTSFTFENVALCRTLTPGHDPVQKVTLIPRGQARGLTWFIPMDDPTLISRQQLFARIVGGLGGRAAEEVIFGEPEVTTGAAGDLQQITGLAKQVYSVYIVERS